ncbi:hypothetical protein LF887_08775 [Chryseobacterium sp. MEBOG06]|uniref:hypothetical protein n=1 Tax=unclassified Chryseobacterium TaxID=2593645 RepID=UPI001F16475E|nr:MULTISPECIES: hypothetical protein [unclassified Chryseobacterium]UKB85701.1 hypothetical protein LF887_08775 [Chryseobacterium sp. MEBOG06]
MKLCLKNPLVLMLYCLMAGMFITVSFLETPLKFQVPGMTLPTALELGKLIFGISTNIQGGFLLLIFMFMFISRRNYTKLDFITIGLLIFILILEKFWILPVLDSRVDLLSSGKLLPPTPLHDFFIYAETAKAVILTLAVIL